MIVVENLSKKFGEVWALRDVTFSVEGGRVVSILGPNGAGKTTLVRILITELLPTSGKAYVAGHDVVREAEKIRRKIAAVPQEGSPIGFLTPREFVYAYLLLRGYPRREARRKTEEALKELQLLDVKDREIQTLSGGTKRRVLLAAVLAADVDVVFLDEPTTGLDVFSRRIVWNAVASMRRRGVTVLLTTHYVEEAQALSDYVVVLNKGEVVDMGTPEALVEKVPGKYVVEAYGASNAKKPHIAIGERAIYFVENPKEVMDTLMETGAKVSIRQKSLEDYILYRVGVISEEV
ncbi:MAG: ABC transporter ATP-binding protein [Thermoproteus sp.]